MGFRFSLEHANWIAHIIQPSGSTPSFKNNHEARESLHRLMEASRKNFYGSKSTRRDFLRAIDNVDFHLFHNMPEKTALFEIRKFFNNIPWCSLLIPSAPSIFNFGVK